MGGIIRCIKNDYNLDQIENEINRTESFQEIFKKVTNNYNPYIDSDIKKEEENNHYKINMLGKIEVKRNNTFIASANKYKIWTKYLIFI